VVVVIAGWEVITHKVNQYMASFLILSGLMIGVFCALDGLLFYVFFEATLIPMYLIIGIWGGPNKIYAAFKFFLYTLLGSLLTLVALIYLYITSNGSFDIATWHALPLGQTAQTAIFFALRCWRPSCSSWAPMGSCAFRFPLRPTPHTSGPA
jgi:NADH-quinone oxidoreductase subunit M